jgi:hypothetical protein
MRGRQSKRAEKCSVRWSYKLSSSFILRFVNDDCIAGAARHHLESHTSLSREKISCADYATSQIFFSPRYLFYFA